VKPSEWLDHVAMIRDYWPRIELPENAIMRWGADLADLPSEHVGAAIDAHYRASREFPPNGGMIRDKAVELMLDAPDWATALDALRRIYSTPAKKVIDYREGEENGYPVADPVFEYPRAELLKTEHPMVVAFVEHAGWEQLITGVDPGATTTGEAQLREKWLAFCRRTHRDVLYRGIPSGGLRALKRIEQGDGGPVPIGKAIAAAREELEPAA
jgi:hypothetical protein